MTLQTPCSDRDNDPDDWFIARDGKQYPADELLTDEDIRAIQEELEAGQFATEDARVEALDKAVDRAEADARRLALQRRRHAREKCHDDCYFRMQCLDLALKNEREVGTWGGYYEEELRAIRTEIARRKRGKSSQE